MYRHATATLRAYAIALIVVIIGVVLSLGEGDWQWFSRAGALVVVVGIVLTSSQIIEDNRRLRRKRQRLEQTGHVANRDWAQDEPRLAQSRQHDEHLFENERSGLYMLIGGTLIWGFGDLVGVLIP